MMNYQSWLNGLYVLEAIAAGFGKNKRYPAKPLEIFGSDSNKPNVSKNELENKIRRNLKQGQNILNQRSNDKE